MPVSLLQPLVERCQTECGIKIELLAKPKLEDGAVQMQQLLDAIKAADPDASDAVLVGTLPKDKHEGKIAELFGQLANDPASGLTLIDASAGLADLLSCKDASEVLNVKKAAMLASKVGQQGPLCLHLYVYVPGFSHLQSPLPNFSNTTPSAFLSTR